MAEKKGFLRRVFSFGSASEEERTPEHGQTPRPSDTEVGREDAPDPDVRPTAAANVIADAEAGAANSDNGGVTPVKEMGKEGSGSSASNGSDAAQKKTAQRSSWK